MRFNYYSSFGFVIAAFLFIGIGNIASAQIKIGTNGSTIAPSSILELESNNQGLLLSRLTDTVAINALNPPNGMLIYLTKVPSVGLYLRKTSGWEFLAGSIGGNGFFNNLTVGGTLIAPSFSGNLVGNASTATTATNAVNVNITNDLSTPTISYPTFVTNTPGSTSIRTSSTNLSYIPSTGVLTAKGFVGNLVGNVTGQVSNALNAVNAANINVLADDASPGTVFPVFVSAVSGALQPNVSTSRLGFKPLIGELTATTFRGDFIGNATTATSTNTATNSLNSAITDDNSNAGTFFPVFVGTASGNQPIKSSSTNLKYVPSTGTLKAKEFEGNLTGNVTGDLTGNVSGTATNITGIVSGANGGTGKNNTGKTITLGGNLETTGAFNTTLSSTGPTNVTLPASGTLATLDGTEIFTNKTFVNPTFTALNLGTPSAMVGTNITGTAAGLTAGKVITNANLTGMVTSLGNATTVVTNANLTGVVTSIGNATAITNGAISNAMLANGAVANLTNTNSGDQTASTVSNLSAGTISATTVQGALNELDTEKAPLASPTFTGTVSGVTAGMVGLGNVSNIADADKPISTATQTALNLKAPLASPTFTGDAKAETATAGDNDLSIATTAFVTTANAINANLTGPVTSVGNATAIADGALSIAKTDGLQTALDLKSPLASPTFTGDAKAETATAGDNDVSIATTAFVTTANAINANLTGPVTSVGNATAIADGALSIAKTDGLQTALDLKSSLASPTFTGDAKAETATAGDNDVSIATTAFVTTANATNANLTGPVTSVGNATAIADGALSIAKTNGLQTALDLKSSLASPTFTGDAKAETATAGDNDVSIATTAFVTTAVAAVPDADASTKGKIQLAGDLSGTATLPTIATDAVNTTKIANGTILNEDIDAAAAIADSKLATIATAGKVSNMATTATESNTPSAIVARDASGNFSAGTITATSFGRVTGTGAKFAFYETAGVDYFITVNDYYIKVNTPVIVKLPSAVGIAGQRFVIYNNTSAAYTSIGTTSLQSITGNTYSGGVPAGAALKIFSDGANWLVE